MTPVWAATWKTESAEVSTIQAPVLSCSGPSSSMICVPEAGLLPMTPRPVSSWNRRKIQSGKPSGYVGKGSRRVSPIISQCPASVALAAESSTMSPCEARGEGSAGTPSISTTLPRPSPWMLGRVFAPSSPKSAASGASPAPTPSSTTTTALPPMLLLSLYPTGGRGRHCGPLCVLEHIPSPLEPILAGPYPPGHPRYDRVTAGLEREDVVPEEPRVREATGD